MTPESALPPQPKRDFHRCIEYHHHHHLLPDDRRQAISQSSNACQKTLRCRHFHQPIDSSYLASDSDRPAKMMKQQQKELKKTVASMPLKKEKEMKMKEKKK